MRASDHLSARFNAADWFVGRHVREGRGNSTAIVTDDQTSTYAELDDRVRRFASVLREAGVHRGDRVAFVLLDGPLLAACFWGTIAAGAVAVPLNTLLKPSDHRKIIDDCDPRLVVIDPSIFDAELTGPETDVWTADETERAIGHAVPSPAYADTHRDALAFFLYSSGTTGEPKGVVHLQHDMWICCETYGKTVLEIQPEDRCFSIAEMFFAYGLGNSLYLPSHLAASSVLRPSSATCCRHDASITPVAPSPASNVDRAAKGSAFRY